MYTNLPAPAHRSAGIRTETVYDVPGSAEKNAYENTLQRAGPGRGMYTMYGKVAAETTIRVPHELKDKLNEIKGKFYAQTPHEAIKRLVDYHEKSEKEKAEQEKYEEESMIDLGPKMKSRFVEIKTELGSRNDGEAMDILMRSHVFQKQNSVNVGPDMKQRFLDVKEDLGLSTDGAVLEFLIENYQGSLQLGMGAFETYKRLRGQGK
ncbi:hypothetical protein D1872_206930 [compost metagenome]